MESKIFHGEIKPFDFSQALLAHFNHGNLHVQQVGEGDQIIVQIASNEWQSSGGKTSITIAVRRVEDGVSVQVGQQDWIGVAASLGFSALAALANPRNLLNRIDDIAQDIDSMQLTQEIWTVIETTARTIGVGTELSDRLKRYVCEYCNTANPPGEPRCIGCGAPLGDVQPETCPHCGFVINKQERVCPNCSKPI
jgi:ribosomal protein L37E